MILPNTWKQYKSTASPLIRYNVILQKRCLTIHCHYMGQAMAARSIGAHAYGGAPASVFKVSQPLDQSIWYRMEKESELLINSLWEAIDFDELTKLLGRPPEDW